jgi:integrase
MAGEGSVFRRASDGAWIAQVSIGPRGDRRYVSRSAKTRTEAREKLDALRAGDVEPSQMTVGDFLERWVTDARDIRDTTRKGYRAVIATHLAPNIGRRLLRDLSPLDVERLLTELGPAMRPKTLRNAHAVLRRALGHAVRTGVLTRNVASRQFVDAPKVSADEPRALTQDEVDRLLEAAHGDRIEAIVVVALGTGLRQGELLGLAWEDIEPNRILVRKELVYRDGKYDRDDPKTERSKRAVPLSSPVRDALEAHRTWLRGKGFVTTATGPVFVNRDGGALNGSWVTHRFYTILERAGIERLPFKNLRTTFASRLYDAGVPDVTIAALLGHTRTHTTRRHYIATTEGQAVEAIERLFGISHGISHGASAGVDSGGPL